MVGPSQGWSCVFAAAGEVDEIGEHHVVALIPIHGQPLKSTCWIPRLFYTRQKIAVSMRGLMLKWSMFAYPYKNKRERNSVEKI